MTYICKYFAEIIFPVISSSSQRNHSADIHIYTSGQQQLKQESCIVYSCMNVICMSISRYLVKNKLTNHFKVSMLLYRFPRAFVRYENKKKLTFS